MVVHVQTFRRNDRFDKEVVDTKTQTAILESI